MANRRAFNLDNLGGLVVQPRAEPAFRFHSAVLAQGDGEKRKSGHAMNHAIQQIISRTVASDEVADIFDVAFMGEGREAGKIGEEDGDLLSFGVRGRRDFLNGRAGRVDRLAAGRTKSRRRRQFRLTVRATGRLASTALWARLEQGGNLGSTGGAKHG